MKNRIFLTILLIFTMLTLMLAMSACVNPFSVAIGVVEYFANLQNNDTPPPWAQNTVYYDIIDDKAYLTGYQFWSPVEVTMPTSIDGYDIVGIQDEVFKGCEYLEKITIGDKVVEIGESAFEDCPNLKTVHMGKNVETVGKRAFANCTKLENLILYPSTKNIEAEAFDNISRRGSLNYMGTYEEWFEINFANKSANPMSAVRDVYFNNEYMPNKFSLPATVTTIKPFAICNLGALVELTIPYTVEVVSSSAITDCSRLEIVYISSGVEYFQPYAISNCPNATLYVQSSTSNAGWEAGWSIGHKGIVWDCQGIGTLTDGTSWININNEVTITKYEGRQTNIILSATINGAPVVKIAERAYEGSSIESITFLANLREIGDGAFLDCTSLKSVTFSDTIKEIGDDAFAGCTSLTNIILPNSLEILGARAFSHCEGLVGVYLPESVVAIGKDAFATNTNTKILCCNSQKQPNWDKDWLGESGQDVLWGITGVIIANNGLIMKDNGANLSIVGYFGGATVEIPETYNGKEVVSIGDRAFANCTHLQNISGGANLVAVGEYAFSGCTSLETGPLSNKTKTIGHNAFENCTSLRDFSMDSNLVSIGEEAFLNCSMLDSFDLATSVEYIGKDAFKGCPDTYMEYYYEELPATWHPEWNPENCLVITGKSGYVSGHDFHGLRTTTGCWITSYSGSNPFLIVPETIGGLPVLGILNGAFEGKAILKTITFNCPITSIRKDVFKNCSNLTSVELPSTITSIDTSAFEGCNALSEVITSSSLIKIGDKAFKGCGNLISITLPQSLTTIGASAFNACTSLREIYIPQNVQFIGENAFEGCSVLTISCEVDEKPSTWHDLWRGSCTVVWGCQREE